MSNLAEALRESLREFLVLDEAENKAREARWDEIFERAVPGQLRIRLPNDYRPNGRGAALSEVALRNERRMT